MVYALTSHNEATGNVIFCKDDLNDWRYEGVIYKKWFPFGQKPLPYLPGT